MSQEQPAELNIEQFIVVNGKRYKAKLRPVFVDPLSPLVTSIEHFIVLIPVPLDQKVTGDKPE